MEHDLTSQFRELVQTKTPIQVQFEMDGIAIPVEFILRRGYLKIIAQGKTCVQLKFDDFVDITDYYFSIGTYRDVCPNLSHDDFFKICNVVAALYGTNLIVGFDASYKDINGFRVESEVLSMTNSGRTFYGKYGIISPMLAPAYKAAAAEFKPEADDLIHRITTFDGDKTARSQLYDELMKFYARVKSKIEEHTEFYLKAKSKIEHTDSTMDEVAQKVPTEFRYISIVNADNSPIEEGVKSSIKISAFTHSGGSRKRKKRKTKKRTHFDFSKR